jgi:hypothetical protein
MNAGEPQDEFLPLWAAEPKIDGWPLWSCLPPPAHIAERDALRAELAEMRAQEPVAWTLTETVQKRETTHGAPLWFSNPGNTAWTPLYAAPTAQPVQAEPVSAEDARDAKRYRWLRDADNTDGHDDWALYSMESLDEYIDAALAAKGAA